jgi:hypothetical protein
MNSQVKTPWAKVTSVIHLDDYQIQIVLDNGQHMVLDLKDLIESKENYWRLRNPRYFRQVKIDPLGGIFWSEGEDLAPDGLERYLKRG